jgi:hypothetical protein
MAEIWGKAAAISAHGLVRRRALLGKRRWPSGESVDDPRIAIRRHAHRCERRLIGLALVRVDRLLQVLRLNWPRLV